MAPRQPPTPFGRLLRYRRKMKGLSQEELASRAEVSVRHLSYVETGRSVPSREMVVAVAYALDVEDEGLFLEAAGYLAPYPDIALDDPAFTAFAKQLRSIVDRQAHPALMHNRFGTVVHYNRLMASLVQRFTEARVSAEQASGHQLLAELRPYVENWDEVAALYRSRLFRELVRGSGDLADEILEQLYQQLDGPANRGEVAPDPLTPLLLRKGELAMRFDLLTVTIGTPQDIGLRNYRMVLLLPADDATATIVAETRRSLEA